MARKGWEIGRERSGREKERKGKEGSTWLFVRGPRVPTPLAQERRRGGREGGKELGDP